MSTNTINFEEIRASFCNHDPDSINDDNYRGIQSGYTNSHKENKKILEIEDHLFKHS